MGKIVVAKKYRLGKDGDKFSEEFKKQIRSKVVIDEDRVKQVNATKQTSGIMYVVDKAATDKRDNEIAKRAEKGQKTNSGDEPETTGENQGSDPEMGTAPAKKKGGRPPKNE